MEHGPAHGGWVNRVQAPPTATTAATTTTGRTACALSTDLVHSLRAAPGACTPSRTRAGAPSVEEAARKARLLGPAVGALAGAFGAFVGVGGGVLISPILASTCK